MTESQNGTLVELEARRDAQRARVRERWNDVRDDLARRADRVTQATDALASVDDRFRRSPWVGIGIAVTLGFLWGRRLPKRRIIGVLPAASGAQDRERSLVGAVIRTTVQSAAGVVTRRAVEGFLERNEGP